MQPLEYEDLGLMELDKRKVLVTGGAGFIGSELVRQLSDSGGRVTVVDNLVNGKRENLAGLDPEQVRLVEADIRDAGEMASLLKEAEVVFHLACLGVRHSIHSPLENHEVNAAATLNLLAAARAAGVERFVYVSTSEVYGTALHVPMDEEHPTFPLTVYGASKLAGDCYSRAYFHTYGFPTVVVRPFNTYGPRCHHEGDCGEVIPRFMLRSLAGKPMVIFGDGEQARDFTFVGDTARGIMLAGTSDDILGETINIGNGKESTINEIAREVAEAIGQKEPRIDYDAPRPGDVRRHYADVKKANERLGYRPEVELSEGLAKLKEWYLAREESPEKLLEEEVLHNWEA